jgi:hypothetical protein
MTDKQRKAIREFLEALALIEENYGYVFRGSDEWKDLVRCRRAVKSMVRAGDEAVGRGGG